MSKGFLHRESTIYKYLVSKKIKRCDVAQKLSVDRDNVYRWFAGNYRPSLLNALKLYYLTCGNMRFNEFLPFEEREELAEFAGVEMENLI